MMREHITNSNESMIFHYPIPFSLVTWLKFVGKKKIGCINLSTSNWQTQRNKQLILISKVHKSNDNESMKLLYQTTTLTFINNLIPISAF